MDLIVAYLHPSWKSWVSAAFHYLIPQHIPQGVEFGQKYGFLVAVEHLCAGRELQGVLIIFRASAHGAIDVDVALIVKGGVDDFIVIVAVGAVAAPKRDSRFFMFLILHSTFSPPSSPRSPLARS